MKPSSLLLCLFLILMGIAVGYYFVFCLFFEMTTWSFIAFVLYIPTFLLGCVLPLYAGIAYLVEIIRNKGADNHAPQD